MPGVDLATLAIRVDSLEAKVAAQNLDKLSASGSRTEAAMGRVTSASSSAAAQIAGLVGITLSLAGAFALAYKAMTTWYSIVSGGVRTVEEFKKTIIGTSYILSTMSDVKPVDLGKTYEAWKEYFNWLYKSSLEADKKAAASAQEIFMIGVELRKKGVEIVSKEQVDTLGRLTDLMKAVTPAYASLAMQARSEIEAMLSGTNRMGAQTAIVLGQIDPKFKENITRAREQNRVMEYFRDLLPQIRQYTLDMMGTLDAVSASLKSAFSVIQIRAFADAHRDVVKFVGDLANKLVENGQLTEQGARFADALGAAWREAKVAIVSAMDYMLNNFPQIVTDVGNIVSAVGKIASAAIACIVPLSNLISKLAELASNPLTYAVLGGAVGGISAGPLGAAVGATVGLVGGAAAKTQSMLNQTLPKQINEQKTALEAANKAIMAQYGLSEEMLKGAASLGPAPPTPKTRPFTGKEEKGGGGGGGAQESAEKSVRSFIETMNQATAQGAGDTEAILQAWKSKQLQTLAELAAKGADISQAKIALSQAVDAKQRKLDEDFNNWYISGMDNQYGALRAAEEKKLAEVAGNAQKTQRVHEVFGRKRLELENQINSNTLGAAKGYYDSMASMSPILEDQLALKRQSLDLELAIAAAALETKIRKGEISSIYADDLRRLQALDAQLKKYNLEMEYNRGLEGWAYGRVKAESQKNTWADFMEGAESFITDAFAQGIQGALTKTKLDFMELGKTLAQSIALNLGKQAIHWGFTAMAKGVLGEKAAGLLGQRGTTPYNPVFVSDVSGGGASNLLGFGGLPRLGGGFPGLGGVGGGIGGEGGGGLPMLGGYLKLAESFKEGEFGLRSTAVMWDSMFMESTSALTNNTSAYRSMFNSSINGLLGSANTFSNIFSSFLGSLSSILSSISGGGGGGGFLDILGGLPIIGSVVKGIQGFGSLTGLFGGGAAAAADVAGVTSMFSALPPVFGIYHQGGVIYAHRGWPRLHSDDVPIIAQTGERVLSRAQNRDYEAGKGGSPQHQTLNFTFVTPAGQVLEKHEMRQIMGEVKSGLKHKTIRVPKTKSALRKW